MRLAKGFIVPATLAILLGACADTSMPTAAQAPSVAAQWGPESPHFNLQVILRGQAGFGMVKFRQRNDELTIIELGTTVRKLAPNTSYTLQRAVDTTLDGICTSSAWLTLGKGLTPQTIMTDASGNGHEDLFRSVAAFPVGSTFDIHFRVVDASTGVVALSSSCYEFTISQ